jgi:uncharacterized protein (DUF4415 family)
MSKVKTVLMDEETAAFVESVRQSLMQAKLGQTARVYSPNELQALKTKRGRPAGSTQAQVKKPTTLRLDEEVLERWRASGKGWQTRAARLLAQHAPA